MPCPLFTCLCAILYFCCRLVSSTSPVKEAPAGAAGTGSPEAAAAEQRLRLALQARYGIASAAVSVSTPDAVSAGATEMGNQPHGLAPAVSLAELRALAMVGLSGA